MEQDSENHLTEYTTMTLTMTLEIQIWEPDTKGQSLEATNTHTQDAVELEDLKPRQVIPLFNIDQASSSRIVGLLNNFCLGLNQQVPKYLTINLLDF